jgi:hypothetical protein
MAVGEVVVRVPSLSGRSISWRASRNRGSRGDSGSASVEMTVLVTPVFVVLVLFVVLCARTASARIDVDAAASSAATLQFGQAGGRWLSRKPEF